MASLEQERMGFGPNSIKKIETPDAAGGGSSSPISPDATEEAYRRGLGALFSEKDPIAEFLQSGTAEEVRIAVLYNSAEITESVVLWDSSPEQYVNSSYVRLLKSRAHSVRNLFGLFKKWPDTYKDSPIVTNRKEKIEFADSLRKSADLLDASLTMGGKVREESAQGGDVTGLSVDGFLRGQQNRVFTDVFNPLFRAEATVEGLPKLGKEIQTGLQAWVNIGRGTAEVRLENGKTKKVQNIFAIPPNHEELNWVIKNYVMPEIDKYTEYKMPRKYEGSKEDWEDYRKYNQEVAAKMAFMVAKFAKIDLSFSWSLDENRGIHPQGNEIAPGVYELKSEELPKWTAAGGPLTANDQFKLVDVEGRRKNEWGKGGREGVVWDENKGKWVLTEHREHLRAIGAPASLGCYPRIFANFFEVATVEVPMPLDSKNEKDKEKLKHGYTTKNVKASVWDLWQKGARRYFTIDEKGEWDLKEEPVDKKWNLDEVPWDGAMLVNEGSDDPYLEFAHGPNANTREIPYGLAIMYATKNVFDIIMRDDFDKLYGEITKSNFLTKLNKPIDTYLVIIGKSLGFDDALIGKLNNYVRTVFLASTCITVDTTNGVGSEIERNAIAEAGDYRNAKDALLSSASRKSFLPVTSGDMMPGSIKEPWKKLYYSMVDNRTCFMPGDIPRDIAAGIFTNEELVKLKKLYPQGLKRRS